MPQVEFHLPFGMKLKFPVSLHMVRYQPVRLIDKRREQTIKRLYMKFIRLDLDTNFL
jgi:hypothetical protein